MTRHNDGPITPVFLDGLIEHLDIKASIELRDDINHYVSYHTTVYYGVWLGILGTLIFYVFLWGVLASWGYFSQPDDDNLALILMAILTAGIVPYGWAVAWSPILDRLRDHIRALAGVE